jgi:protein-disulfide isomerase
MTIYGKGNEMLNITRRAVVAVLSAVILAVPATGLWAQDAETPAPEVIEMTMGSDDATVTVIEYASFTCPHCQRFHSDVMPQLKANYIDTGKIKFVFREVYFDKYGMWASLIARCAGPDRYFGVSGLIFDNLNTWARAGSDLAVVNELSKLGAMAGLESDEIQACLQDRDKLGALVGWYRDNVTRDDVSSTPTLIINGVKHSNMSYDELAVLLDEQLAD